VLAICTHETLSDKVNVELQTKRIIVIIIAAIIGFLLLLTEQNWTLYHRRQSWDVGASI